MLREFYCASLSRGEAYLGSLPLASGFFDVSKPVDNI
jgi:hypothetical protein